MAGHEDRSDRLQVLSLVCPSVHTVPKPAHVSRPALTREWKNTGASLTRAKLTGVTLAPQGKSVDHQLAHVYGERVVV